MRSDSLSRSRGFSLPELLPISRNATGSGAGVGGVTGRRRSGAWLVILCALFLSLPAPPVAAEAVLYQATITAGQRSYNAWQWRGYDHRGGNSAGSIAVTQVNAGLGTMDGLFRQYRSGHDYIELHIDKRPSNTDQDAFIFLRIKSGGNTIDLQRSAATHHTYGTNHTYWQWTGSAVNAIPKTTGNTLDIALYGPTPPPPFHAVFEAEVTVGKIGSQWGYQYHRLVPTGSIRITRGDQDVMAGLTKQVRTTNNMYLYMPEDEGDADSLFDRMRIVAGGRHRTFRRDEADFVTVQFGQRYWLWSTGGDIIPDTVGATYTLQFSRPQADCVWLREWSRCQAGTGGIRRQTMTPVAGRWTDATWTPTPGCTPPGPAPATFTRTCGGVCEFRGESADPAARGNIGCFH